MRKKLALFAILAALSSWSLAQTNNTSSQNNNQGNDSISVVSGPSVEPANDHAVIRWRTDKIAASLIKYGTDPNNMSQQQNISGGARDHKVTLVGLQPGTKYYYEILTTGGDVRKTGDFTTTGSSSASTGSTSGSASTSGSSTSSGTQTGSSTGTSGASDNVQIVDGPRTQNLTPNSTTIFWQTNNIAASDVKYGLDPNNLDRRAFERGGEREHTAELTNLEPGKTYYYQILRRDGSVRTSGQFSTPTSNASTTPSTGGAQSSNNPTVNVSRGPVPQYVNQNMALISWQTDKQSSSTVKYGNDPNNLNQTATGNWGTNHQVQIQGLQPSTTYYYQVQSSPAEGTGNVATSQTANFQTVAPGQQAKQQARPF